MAKEEPVIGDPVTHDVTAHVQDYSKFTRLLKVGAIICFIVGIGWMLIVKAYW